MASTFTAMSSAGSQAVPGCQLMDKKLAASSGKLSSSASISSRSFGRRQLALRRNQSPQISAMAKDLHFIKDGSAIKKLQRERLEKEAEIKRLREELLRQQAGQKDALA